MDTLFPVTAALDLDVHIASRGKGVADLSETF